MRAPETIDVSALLELVQCPPLLADYTPREQASPSALQQYAACQRSWGERYLHGRRETQLEWEYARRIPEPPKAKRGCSALEKATLELAKKAWNKVRRPALGTDVHAILGAYMVQNVPRGAEGAWHAPMPWREIDWHSEAGKIARPAADVLPDPKTLVAVYTELAAEVEAPRDWLPGRDGPWPRMPGFYDLITVERATGVLHYHPESDCYWVEATFDVGDGLVSDVTGVLEHEQIAALRNARPLVFRLWDYKSTSSFDWAKTEEELREDPQVLLYALHAMQTFGLEEIECNWVYLLTDPEKRPKSYVVTVTTTRAEAEAAVLEMAETAAEVVETVRLFSKGKLRVVDLEMNTAACTAYGGCVYHISKGGPCDAKVSPGKAMKQKAELDAKIQARKAARKETEKTMALSAFEQKRADRAAKLKAEQEAKGGNADGTAPAGGESAAEAGSEQSAGGGSEPSTGGAEASAASSAATTKLRENRPKAVKASAAVADAGGVSATVDGFSFAVPASSALGKQLAKAAKGLQAAASAFEGE